MQEWGEGGGEGTIYFTHGKSRHKDATSPQSNSGVESTYLLSLCPVSQSQDSPVFKNYVKSQVLWFSVECFVYNSKEQNPDVFLSLPLLSRETLSSPQEHADKSATAWFNKSI